MSKPTKKTIMVNIRVTEVEKRKMQDKANKHTDGNLSAWVKYAAINYIPKKPDQEK